jgi:hypothetical protein
MKSKVLVLVLCLGILGFVSCNQSSVITENAVLKPQLTSSVKPKDWILAGNAPAILQNVPQAEPLQLWSALGKSISTASANSENIDGVTLTFTDFFGAPYAYVNQVSRDGNTNPQAMLATYLSKEKDSKGLYVEGHKDSKDWTIGTYISGASTLRLVLGSTIYGFPLLEGLFGKEAVTAQIPTLTKSLMMPDNNTFFAELTDGRYWDIMAKTFVPNDLVQTAKERYRQMLEKVQTNSVAKSKMLSSWAFAKSNLGAKVEQCEGSLCPPTGFVSPQQMTTTTECYTWWILWWPQTRCKNHYYVYLNDNQLFPAMSRNIYSPNALSKDLDNYQTTRFLDSNNPQMSYFSGCSPTAVAELLIWFHYYRGVATGRTDYYNPTQGIGSDDNKWVNLTDFDAWQWDLRYAMGTTNQATYNTQGTLVYYQGGTYSFSIKPGANSLFATRNIGVRAYDTITDVPGAIFWQSASLENIKNSVKYVMGQQNLPMIISATPEWPSGHTGVAKSFDIDDDLQSIYGKMVNPPTSAYQGNIVFGYDIGSGVIWLQQYP